MPTVDLNADLGEGFGRWDLGDDTALLRVITSANVACGFHAGDPPRLLAVCDAARKAGVRIGAQVSYRDLAGFGRRFIDVPPAELRAEIIYQIGGLQALARSVGAEVGYVKPHGALYHAVVDNPEQAAAVIDAVRAVDDTFPVLGLPGSALFAAAERAGLRTVAEVFADRGYQDNGLLVPRGLPGALVIDPSAVAARAVAMATGGTVISVTGHPVQVSAESICLHGDSPGAAGLAAAVRRALEEAGCMPRSFLDA